MARPKTPFAGVCSRCKRQLADDDFCPSMRRTGGYCRVCHSNIRREQRTPETTRRHNLKHMYNLQVADYESILSRQNGRCAICGTDKPGGRGYFHVDHDHECCPGRRGCGGCVRGLLCNTCNAGIGLLGDDVDRLRAAIHYLEAYQRTVV